MVALGSNAVAEIELAEDKGRFIARDADGNETGWIGYRLSEGVLNIWTTRTHPEARGKGVADAITSHVVKYAIDNKFAIDPTCWYSVEWFSKHPEFSRYLVDPGF
jgi:predicted GNAT family acetyltransferase